MLSYEELEEMKLKQLLHLTKDYKLKIIEMLINQIAQDDVQGAIECFKTEKEQIEYLKWLDN